MTAGRRNFEITVSDPIHGCRTVDLTGEIDLAAEAALNAALQDAIIGTGVAEVVIDFSELRFLDCSGLHALVSAAWLAAAAGVTLHARGCHGMPERLLRLTGVDGPLHLDQPVTITPGGHQPRPVQTV